MGKMKIPGNILYLPAPFCLLVSRLEHEMETLCAQQQSNKVEGGLDPDIVKLPCEP